MKSKPCSEPLDLDRGIPTTAADVAALRALPRVVLDGEAYLRFLALFQPESSEELRNEPGPSGEPFRLP